MNSGNINVGKYSLDHTQVTPEERIWVIEMARKHRSNINFNAERYYSFDNFHYENDTPTIVKGYPLITIQELKEKYYGSKIYELW